MRLRSLLAPLRWKHRRAFGLDALDLRLAEHLVIRGGVFVEAGANDGVSQSNTMYFESYRDWTGVLIEPLPRLADACRRNRPRSTVVQCALVASNDITSVSMCDCNLMSVVRGAFATPEAEEDHLQSGFAVQGLARTDDIVVPARTLTTVLREHAMSHVDLLSLDVEGYENQALQGLDLDRVRPTYILVEARTPEVTRGLLSTHYDEVGFLSHHDILFRVRRPVPR